MDLQGHEVGWSKPSLKKKKKKKVVLCLLYTLQSWNTMPPGQLLHRAFQKHRAVNEPRVSTDPSAGFKYSWVWGLFFIFFSDRFFAVVRPCGSCSKKVC